MLDFLENEQDYIRRISTGDEKAFADLFEHYRNRIYTFVMKITRSPNVSEEIVEDVFLKIWQYRGRLNEIENFRSYLFTIARNQTYKILKQIAANYKTVLLTEQHELPSYQNSEDLVIAKEFNSILQKAIDRLPKQQKQVYELMRIGDLKRGEVASLMKLKPETVKFHLAQAMKNIRAFCMMHLNTLLGFIIILTYALLEVRK